MSLDAKYATVEEIITKLSLGKCADSIVGGAKVPFVLVLWQLKILELVSSGWLDTGAGDLWWGAEAAQYRVRADRVTLAALP